MTSEYILTIPTMKLPNLLGQVIFTILLSLALVYRFQEISMHCLNISSELNYTDLAGLWVLRILQGLLYSKIHRLVKSSKETSSYETFFYPDYSFSPCNWRQVYFHRSLANSTGT